MLKTKSLGRTLTALTVVCGLATGCAVNDDDLARWQTTQGGPKRLSAVVLHDKYPFDLRVRAAMSLIGMKPRKGRHVGIERLVKGTLSCDPEYDKDEEPCQKHKLTAETRAKINADLIPAIIAELQKPPPAPTQNGQPAPDPSFRYKDAAYLMLSFEGAEIVSDSNLKGQLEKALIDWAMADFTTRLEDRNQAYGMEQLLSYIGPTSVEQLPSLMVKEGRALSKMADIIARIGSKATKEAAGAALVKVAERVASDAWLKEKEPEVREANRAGGLEGLSEKGFKKQLARYQTETLIRVFASMKKVGGDAVRDYALKVAADEKVELSRRIASMAALEGHIGAKDDKAIAALFDIIESKAPAQVKDKAFARVRELPRDKVAERLYKIVSGKDWLLRRVAGTTLLTLSKAEHAKEYLDKLESFDIKNPHLDEVIKYGKYLSLLEGDDLLKTLESRMKPGNKPISRLSSLAYWYAKGTKKDLAAIEPYLNDSQRIPKCDGAENEDCGWKCTVKEKDKDVPKEIKTVGDFMTHCIKPKMMTNEPKKKDDGSAKKKGGSGDKKDGK